MIDCTPKPYLLEKSEWCTAAEEGLSKTFYGHMERIRDGVQSGVMELFRVSNHSWLVTQIVHGRKLFIWCYQGRNMVMLIDKLKLVCRAQNPPLTQIGFFTRHKGVIRAFRRYNVQPVRCTGVDETEYILETT